MIGAIIGDIVGSRFEFNNHLSTQFALFDDDCRFTDDTICTVAVADALINRTSKHPFETQFEPYFVKWYNRYPTLPYGHSFVRFLQHPENAPYDSFGNGSAMRVSPCAWYSFERNKVLDMAMKSAECSHNHQEGIRGALCIADCIHHARFNADKNAIRTLASEVYGYNLNATCDEIRNTNTFNPTCQVTVPQAVTALLESSDFESAIRLAVSLGGDSDTIAAMTGSMAEAMYGIPAYIKETAMAYLPDDIRDVIDEFYKTFGLIQNKQSI